VIFQGKIAEGVLDGLGIGVPRDAKNLVKVALRNGIDGVTPVASDSRR
jgi:hypothetical protein